MDARLFFPHCLKAVAGAAVRVVIAGAMVMPGAITAQAIHDDSGALFVADGTILHDDVQVKPAVVAASRKRTVKRAALNPARPQLSYNAALRAKHTHRLPACRPLDGGQVSRGIAGKAATGILPLPEQGHRTSAVLPVCRVSWWPVPLGLLSKVSINREMAACRIPMYRINPCRPPPSPAAMAHRAGAVALPGYPAAQHFIREIFPPGTDVCPKLIIHNNQSIT